MSDRIAGSPGSTASRTETTRVSWGASGSSRYSAVAGPILAVRVESQFNGETADVKISLLRGRNEQKDQSYFLWELTQAQLSRALFPLGEMSKPEAREGGGSVVHLSNRGTMVLMPEGLRWTSSSCPSGSR